MILHVCICRLTEREKKRKRESSQDTHLLSAKPNLGCRYTLGETVCNHVSSGNEVCVKHTMFHLVPEPVETKIQVLHTTMMFRILGDSDCTLVVHLESGSLINTIPKL